MPQKPTAVVYCRTSTTQQKEADTIEAQKATARALLERHGLELVPSGPEMTGWWIDNGVSGALLDGRCFKDLLEELASGALKPDYLIVYNLSRLARIDTSSKDVQRTIRSAEAAARIKPILIASGTKILESEGVVDPRTILFDLKVTFASEDYRGILQRTSAGKARRLGEGAFAKGGKPPYGYTQTFKNGKDKRQGYVLAPHPEEAPRLRQILAWYAEGGTGYAVKKAMAARIPTPMAGTTERKNAGKDWTPYRWTIVTVQNLAKAAESYFTGELSYDYRGERYTLNFEPVIDYDLFARVERRKKEHRRGPQTTFLCTHHVDCSCGAHVSARLSSGHHHARCNGGTKAARTGADTCCGSMRADAFNRFLWSVTVARLIQIRRDERALEGGGPEGFDAKLRVARANLENVHTRLARVAELYELGELDLETFKRRNEPLKSEKARLVAELAKLDAAKKAALTKSANEQTLAQKLSMLLVELGSGGEAPLDLQRQVLRDLLQAGRVVAHWGPREVRGTCTGSSTWVELRFPAFGALPPLAVRSDAPVWKQVLGADVTDATNSERMLIATLLGKDGRSVPFEVVDGRFVLVDDPEVEPEPRAWSPARRAAHEARQAKEPGWSPARRAAHEKGTGAKKAKKEG